MFVFLETVSACIWSIASLCPQLPSSMCLLLTPCFIFYYFKCVWSGFFIFCVYLTDMSHIFVVLSMTANWRCTLQWTAVYALALCTTFTGLGERWAPSPTPSPNQYQALPTALLPLRFITTTETSLVTPRRLELWAEPALRQGRGVDQRPTIYKNATRIPFMGGKITVQFARLFSNFLKLKMPTG